MRLKLRFLGGTLVAFALTVAALYLFIELREFLEPLREFLVIELREFLEEEFFPGERPEF